MTATAVLTRASWHERHIARRMEARGEDGLVEALLGLKGVVVAGRHRIESLYAIGGEGAVYLTRDLADPDAGYSVAKVALLALHRPFTLEAESIRRQRNSIRIEARYLESSGSRFLPTHCALLEFENPLLDRARCGAFGEPEPFLLMEKLPGRDLDRWLARMHRSGVPRAELRRTLDRVSVVLLQALVDLNDRGYYYADLRPANLRVIGRPERVVRLLDAGSLVSVNDRSGRFPHVPSYLPPALFLRRLAGRTITPSAETQAIMAGRTLYEVATGLVPHPGDSVNLTLLADSNVSPPVAEVIEGLCQGDFADVRHALRYLEKRASRRVCRGNDPTIVSQTVAVDASTEAPEAADPQPRAGDRASVSRARRGGFRGWLRRLFGRRRAAERNVVE